MAFVKSVGEWIAQIQKYIESGDLTPDSPLMILHENMQINPKGSCVARRNDNTENEDAEKPSAFLISTSSIEHGGMPSFLDLLKK